MQMLKLYANYRNLLRRRRNATQQRTETQRNMPARIDLCGMLCPLTYDDAVYVNAAVEINVAMVRSVNRVLVYSTTLSHWPQH